MNTSIAIVTGFFFLSGLFPWLLLGPTWNNRERPGATGILVVIPSVSVYALTSWINTVTTIPWLWYVASNLVLLSLASAAVGWFLAVAEYTGYVERPLRALKGLGVLLLIDQVLAWTNPLHHLYYDPIETMLLPGGIAPNAGILFLIHTAGVYFIVGLGILASLTDASGSRGIRRKQNLALVGSVVPPVVSSLVWIPRWTPFNFMPLAFVLSVFVLAWVVFEADFLDVIPRGRERAVRTMDDPLVIVDDEGRVVESNPAARELVGVGSDWNAMPASQFFSPFSGQFEQFQSTEAVETDISLTRDGEQRHFKLRISSLGETGQDTRGRVILLSDVTRMRERERTLDEFQNNTEQILSGRNRESVCEATIDATRDVIGVSYACVHLYNRREEALVPVATSEAFEGLFEHEHPVHQDPDSLLWEIYRGDEIEHISEDARLKRLFRTDEIPVESVLLAPFESHGILVLPAVEAETFEETDLYFARLLSATVETALDRTQRERGLATVQEVSRDAITATTHEEMAETVLAQVPEALDFPLSGIWRHDPTVQRLQPMASTGPADPLFDEMPVFRPGNSIAWRAFEESRTTLVSRTSDHPDAHNPDSPISSEVISPIGEFGVFAAGSTQEGSFTENERRILETLATNLRTASRLIERRRDLRLLDQVLGRVLRHNLRNKLSVVQATAEQIRDTGDSETSALAENVLWSCHKLQDTAEHAQDMREIIKNREETERISLELVVNEAVGAVTRDFPAANIQTEIDSDETVLAHPNLATAVEQLVRNGVEHNTGTGTPTVSVRVVDTVEGPAIKVVDDGPGLSQHERAVLEKHGESALEHGSGVGLWIVDRVAEYSNASLDFTVDDGTVARLGFVQ